MYVEICTTPHSRKDPRRAFKRFPSVIRTGKNMYRIQAEDRKLRKIRRICRRRYCHRRISDQKLTVDHIYPVYMTKTGNNFWMRLIGIANVNDVRNLAPACRRCNIKKGRKAGIWIVKAIVGKHEIYWMIRRLLQLALLALIAYLAVSCHLPELIRSLILALHL